MSVLPPDDLGMWIAEFNDCDSGYFEHWWTAVLHVVESCGDGTPVDIETSVWVKRMGEMYLVTYEDAVKSNTEYLLRK